jgi:uncharacterized damage-inducible protein DinB
MSAAAAPAVTSPILSAPALLEHWQGHRRLTRRVIDAFAETQLLNFAVGGMRPFGALAMELLTIGVPMVRGVVTSEWHRLEHPAPTSKRDVLRLWDEDTAALNDLWPRIPLERFQDTVTAFGQYPGKVYDLLFYAIDNEIHHRGQGYVYLRALGVAPPAFYERE